MSEESFDGESRVGMEITGRVQGVGFRWWTRQKAEALGVRGTVRNRRDGAVEVHLAGPPDRLEEMEARLRKGPASARVEAVRRIEPADSLPDGFEILR